MQNSSFSKSRIMAFSFGRNSHRSGFTLLELLVTIGLLVLLMSIFATIFQQATRIFAVQRGILSNDQRSRVLYKQLEDDLRNLSFKSLPGMDGIIPYVGAYTNTTTGETQMLTFAGNPYPEQMKGYLYISENDPSSDTDDVLQFTIEIPEGNDLLAGKADQVGLTWASSPDTPDADDGNVNNQTTISSMAEVSYFMRGTTLYRRQLLLREPAAPLEQYPLEAKIQPRFQTSAGPPPVNEDVFRPVNFPFPTYNFYTSFDLSSHFELPPMAADPSGYAKIHGSLSNDPRINPYPLGNPNFRFGHYHTTGNPREFVTNGTINRFIGRFNHEETSDLRFGYPQIVQANNPFTRNDYDLTNFDRTGRLSDDYSGIRKGEDILMTNVLSFNVQVWDNSLKEFANLGHPGRDYVSDTNNNGTADPGETDGVMDGDYQAAAFTKNPGYGDPSVAVTNRRIFDTWHPLARAGTPLSYGSGAATAQTYQPPVRTPEYALYTASTAEWETATPTAAEQTIRDSYAIRWQSAPAGGVNLFLKNGDLILPTIAHYNDPDRNPSTTEVIPEELRDIFAFKVRVLYDTHTTANSVQSDDLAAFLNALYSNTEPAWPSYTAQNIDFKNSDKLTYTIDYNPSAPGTDIEVIELQKVLNFQPLKALKVTVLFRDIGSDQIRQLSYIESLAD